MQFMQKTIHNMLHTHAFGFGVFVSLFAFVFFAGGLVVANGQTLEPNDSHVVSLYVDGEERIVPTRAATVGELLANAGVTLREYDLVEPGIAAEIDSDNFSVQVYRAKPITIIDGEKQQRIMTPYSDARLIAEKAGIKTYAEDYLNLVDANSFVDEQIIGQKLIIDRANTVTLSLYGAPAVTYRTHADTVGELLKEKGIIAEPGATITPAEPTKLTPNTAVFVSKFGKQIVTRDEEVAFPIESTPDPSQPLGKITITSAGKKGKKQVVYEVTLRDGKEISKRVIQDVVTEEPVKQVQLKGTKNVVVTGDKLEWMRAAGIADSDFAAVDFIIKKESGWRPGALNAGGCAGLGQACPGSKLAKACPNWQTDPVCQLKFFSGYTSRYGGWQGAYNAWQRQGWW